MEKSMGTCRGCGRRFSMPQSGSVDKDEEQVQSKSSKVRVYDKISQTGKISPLLKIAELENTIKNLQQPLMEEVRQRSDMIQQYKLTELSLKKENEMLQEELENTKCLLAKKSQRAEESSVENCRLKKQVEELSKKNGELQETHVKILQEKEEQKMEFESVYHDLQVQISSLSASQMFLEDQTNSLQSEMDRRALASDEEKVLLKGIVSELKTSLDSLNKDLESSRAMEQEKQGQIVDLQDQLASLSAAKMLLEEETKSLQSKMDRRMSVLEEEKVYLKGILRELEKVESDLLENGKLKKDLQSKDIRLQDLTEKVQSHLLENKKLKKDIESKDIRLRLLLEMLLENGKEKCVHESENEKVQSDLLEIRKLKKDLQSKDIRLQELTEKVQSDLLENKKLKKDIESKDIRHRLLLEMLLENGKEKCVHESENEKVQSDLLEIIKLKKDLQSKDILLQELTEKVQSDLLENKKLKKDIESKNDRLRLLIEMLLENGKEKCVHEIENEKANGKIDMKTAQAKSMSEKRTPS